MKKINRIKSKRKNKFEYFGGLALNVIKPWIHESMFICMNIIKVGSVETVVKSPMWRFMEPGKLP